jgi:DHA1 family bicyclomycin/chloramphenicol resistance-like MFS transporter
VPKPGRVAAGPPGRHVIIPALLATARALGMSVGTAQLTITLYLIGLAIGQLLYGPVSDRLGCRPVLLAGLSLFTVASIVTALAPNAMILTAARILQSIGGCVCLVLGRAAAVILRIDGSPNFPCQSPSHKHILMYRWSRASG